MKIIKRDRESLFLRTAYAHGTMEDGTEFNVDFNINMSCMILTFPEAIYTVPTQGILEEVIAARSPKLRLVELDFEGLDGHVGVYLNAESVRYEESVCTEDTNCSVCGDEMDATQSGFTSDYLDYVCTDCVVIVSLESLFSVPIEPEVEDDGDSEDTADQQPG